MRIPNISFDDHPREGRKNGQNVVRGKKEKTVHDQLPQAQDKYRALSYIAPRSLSPRIPKTIDGYCGRVVADGERKRSLRRSCFVDCGDTLIADPQGEHV